jgi:hypothetical protein
MNVGTDPNGATNGANGDDSIDHVVHADLLQSAQVSAATAWGLLNGERLPHQSPSERR